ncbi:MFS transporter [Peribacillus frigoritolerans]|uniref:MFS transporter n=1 Tax=Peribacillus frigoritolerans TaxID=450367 RepID=UPI003D286350
MDYIETMTRGKRIAFLFGLFFASFSTMFIIAGSGVFTGAAVSEFNGMEYFGLVFTLESLARCVILPLSGKLGDIYGRKKLFLVSVICYVAATLVCGFSTGIWMFISGRILMGLTWGLFYANTFAMVTDVFNLSEGPRMIGFLQSVGITAMILAGPGSGAIMDLLNWRYIFYASIPFLLISWLLVAKFMPEKQIFGQKPELDVKGAVLTALALTPFSLALAFGGSKYAWGSPQIIGMFIATIIFSFILIAVERKASDPIFPSSIFRNRNYMMVLFISASFVTISGSGNFLPTYAQTFLHTSASLSGFLNMPSMVVGFFVASIVGNHIAKTGKYKGILIWFTVTALISTAMYFTLGTSTGIVFIMAISAIMGICQGINQVAPNTYPTSVLTPSMVGTGIAFMSFGQTFANTVSNSFYSAILNTGFENVFHSTIIFAVLMIIGLLFYREQETKLDKEHLEKFQG